MLVGCLAGSVINFDKLSRKEKESLLNDLSVLRFKSGQFIVQQGETTARDQPSLYIIASGCASILIDGIEKLIVLGPGETLGDRSLLLNEPRTASVSAIEDVVCLGLSRDTYVEHELSKLKWKSIAYADLSAADNDLVFGQAAIQAALKQKVLNKIEKEVKLEEYEDLDAFKDFNELVIQFGYLTLFAVALPLAPLLAVLNNFFEIRGDAYALCKAHRRREFKTKRGIGSWQGVLEIIAMLAVITNALLTGFVNSTIADLDPEINVTAFATQNDRFEVSRLWMWVFVFEHACLVFRMLLRDVMDRETWIDQKKKVVKLRVKKDIKSTAEGHKRRRRASLTAGAVDAFVSQMKKAANVEHGFSMEHSTVHLSNIAQTLADERLILAAFRRVGYTVLAVHVRMREGVRTKRQFRRLRRRLWLTCLPSVSLRECVCCSGQ